MPRLGGRAQSSERINTQSSERINACRLVHVRLQFILAVGSLLDEAVLGGSRENTPLAQQGRGPTCAAMEASCCLYSAMTASATVPSTISATLQSVFRCLFLMTLRVRGTAGTSGAGAGAGSAAGSAAASAAGAAGEEGR